jgi:hypothetical protein
MDGIIIGRQIDKQMEWNLIGRKGGQGLEGGELTASGLPMTEATVLEASARMAEVSTPSRFTFVDTFRHGILAHLQLVFSASESGPLGCLLLLFLSVERRKRERDEAGNLLPPLFFLGSKQQSGVWAMGPLQFRPIGLLTKTESWHDNDIVRFFFLRKMTLLDAQTITYIYDTDH